MTPERRELYAAAKAAGIPNYSRLSNDDLRDALDVDQERAADQTPPQRSETVAQARRRLGRRFRLSAWSQGHQ